MDYQDIYDPMDVDEEFETKVEVLNRNIRINSANPVALLDFLSQQRIRCDATNEDGLIQCIHDFLVTAPDLGDDEKHSGADGSVYLRNGHAYKFSLEPSAVSAIEKEFDLMLGFQCLGFFPCVKFYITSAGGDKRLLISERLRGTPLASMRRPFHQNEVQNVCNALYDCVQTLHAHKIAHLDLHCGNVMYHEHDGIKILDFGLSCGKLHDCRLTCLWRGYENFPNLPPEFKCEGRPDGRIELEDAMKADYFSMGYLLKIIVSSLLQHIPPNQVNYHGLHPGTKQSILAYAGLDVDCLMSAIPDTRLTCQRH